MLVIALDGNKGTFFHLMCVMLVQDEDKLAAIRADALKAATLQPGLVAAEGIAKVGSAQVPTLSTFCALSANLRSHMSSRQVQALDKTTT